jgi:hypothetical protein
VISIVIAPYYAFAGPTRPGRAESMPIALEKKDLAKKTMDIKVMAGAGGLP